ncbi:hypothetical protein [Corynebacterium diphtheriae]|uniref:hypothetical protein n=1 Tax=Corynebacterium diphtheriae TaxID=1717 RepID=UPI001F5377DA|nr:hypothetical protein [Corynebacterium diphtheriae]
MQKQQYRIAAMVVAGTLLASSGQFAVANAAEKETEQAPATSTQGSSNLAHSTFKSETPEVHRMELKDSSPRNPCRVFHGYSAIHLKSSSSELVTH